METRPQSLESGDTLPLFVKWYGFTDWLLDAVEGFPKKVRFTFCSRMSNLSLDILEDIVEAQYRHEKGEILVGVNRKLERLRILLRLAHGKRYLSTRAYERAVRDVDEAGRMLGGWMKEIRNR